MRRLGWLKATSDPRGGKRARKDYRITSEGKKVLGVLREHVDELHQEMVGASRQTR
jgi:DNA-binding PadR family transcriptional regulator